MKYVKMLGLLAVAAAAFMAFATAASATSLTSNEGTTPMINAKSEGTTTLHMALGGISCEESSVTGRVEIHGGATVGGKISSLTFGKCNHHVTVVKPGSLSVASTATTGNGTLTSTGAEVSLNITSLGLTCVFTTENTHIGTVTGGTGATMHIDSAKIPRTGGSFFCGSSGEWTGSYSVTKPTTLSVH